MTATIPAATASPAPSLDSPATADAIADDRFARELERSRDHTTTPSTEDAQTAIVAPTTVIAITPIVLPTSALSLLRTVLGVSEREGDRASEPTAAGVSAAAAGNATGTQSPTTAVGDVIEPARSDGDATTAVQVATAPVVTGVAETDAAAPETATRLEAAETPAREPGAILQENALNENALNERRAAPQRATVPGAQPPPTQGAVPATPAAPAAPDAAPDAVKPIESETPATIVGATSTPPPRVGAPAGTEEMRPTAPAAPAAPPAPAEQLVTVLEPLRNRSDGNYELRLELKPPELGRVEIRVEMRNGVMHAHLRAEQPAAAQALRDALTQLRDHLSGHGVQAGTLDVDAGSTGPRHGQDDAPPEQSHRNDDRRSNSHATEDRIRNSIRPTGPPNPTSPTGAIDTASRLDIHA